ncbi:hypothetical protein FOA52_005373 [Chlamydomonas sp. UWO 241]|nr:hypothetical protein FOA52_005373 [Chlamydomonas sp. UWO 241]
MQLPPGRKVFLVQEDPDDAGETESSHNTPSQGADPKVAEGIERYIQKQASRGSASSGGGGVAALLPPSDADADGSGGDDEDDDLNADGEVDYEFMGRMTLKSTREALAEVLVEERNSRGGVAPAPAPATPAASAAKGAPAPKPAAKPAPKK